MSSWAIQAIYKTGYDTERREFLSKYVFTPISDDCLAGHKTAVFETRKIAREHMPTALKHRPNLRDAHLSVVQVEVKVVPTR